MFLKRFYSWSVQIKIKSEEHLWGTTQMQREILLRNCRNPWKTFNSYYYFWNFCFNVTNLTFMTKIKMFSLVEIFQCVFFFLSQEMSVVGICSWVPESARKSLCWGYIRHFLIQRWAVGQWNMTWGFTVRPAGLHSISECFLYFSAHNILSTAEFLFPRTPCVNNTVVLLALILLFTTAIRLLQGLSLLKDRYYLQWCLLLKAQKSYTSEAQIFSLSFLCLFK